MVVCPVCCTMNKVKISLVGTPGERSVALVYSIDDIERLRNLGVAGILVGTLPSASQQNVFLGVPLRIMLEEALWLVEAGHAYFAHNTQRQLETRLGHVQREQVEELLLRERESKQRQLEANPKLMEQSVFRETYNESGVLGADKTGTDRDISDRILAADSQLRKNYEVYKSLREDGYFLSPGARFGGRYIAYPGDPLRYHSHLTVQDAMEKTEEIDLLKLINGARLGTSVKKVWVIPGMGAHSASSSVDYYSVEWAGFG